MRRVLELLNELSALPGDTPVELNGELIVERADADGVDTFACPPVRCAQDVVNFLRQFEGDRCWRGGVIVGDRGPAIRAELPAAFSIPIPQGDGDPGAPVLSGQGPLLEALPPFELAAERAGVGPDRLADALEAFAAVGREALNMLRPTAHRLGLDLELVPDDRPPEQIAFDRLRAMRAELEHLAQTHAVAIGPLAVHHITTAAADLAIAAAQLGG